MTELFNKAANGLKLIAIKSLAGCDRKYLNVLTPGMLYYFFPGYVIDPATENITVKESLPAAFYNNDDLKVNVCAIAGKNGSGKSTLVELLLRLVNNMALRQRLPQNELQHLPDLNLALYYYTDTFYKMEVNGRDVLLYKYSLEGVLHPKPKRNVRVPDFFYSIVVNFSHYAYNKFDEGSWLDPLFHKNDGYQAPVVITPFRRDGNIDINIENELVLARLISNFMVRSAGGTFDFRNLSYNLRASAIKLTLKESKRNKPLWNTGGTQKRSLRTFTLNDMKIGGQKERILTRLDALFPFNYEYIDPAQDALAIDYIMYKLISICLKYVDYNEYFDKKTCKFKDDLIGDFLERLVSDNSHVTLKLRQMLNHLLFREIPLRDQRMTLDELDAIMDKVRRKFGKRHVEPVELLPPPVFATEILLQPKNDPLAEEVSFSKLSSGEKQILYSVSSVLYHLVNLDSVKQTAKRRKYRYVNIIMEEVELYFHPEMQRGYVKYFLDALAKMNLNAIDSVNICMVTHSPFVLSDIPRSNILFLSEGGRPANDDLRFTTFGANIHDLLKQSFFLENGAMGEFAKMKINDTIRYLNYLRLRAEIEELTKLDRKPDAKLLEAMQVELGELKEEIVSFDRQVHEDIIRVIDEPILKEKLSEMFDEYTGRNTRLAVIEEKIRILNEEAGQLRKTNP